MREFTPRELSVISNALRMASLQWRVACTSELIPDAMRTDLGETAEEADVLAEEFERLAGSAGASHE